MLAAACAPATPEGAWLADEARQQSHRAVLELHSEAAGQEERSEATVLPLLEKMVALDSGHPKICGWPARLHGQKDPEAGAALLERLGVAPACHELGSGFLALFQGEAAEAVERADDALDRYVMLEHAPGMASSVLLRGQAAIRTRDYDLAEASLERALNLFDQLEDTSGQSSALTQLGRLLRSRGRYEDAAGFQARAVELARSRDDERALALSLHALGDSLDRAGRSLEAIDPLLEAVELRHRIDTTRNRIDSSSRLATVYGKIDRHSDAMQRWDEAIELAVEGGRTRRGVRLLADVAHHWVDHGDLNAARQAVDRGLDLAGAADDRRAEAAIVFPRGRIEALEGDLGSAKDTFNEVIRLCRASEYPSLESKALSQLASIEAAQGDLTEAFVVQRRAHKIEQELRRFGPRADALSNLAAIAHGLGDLQVAERYTRAALELLEQAEDPAVRRSSGRREPLLLNNLCVLLTDSGDLSAAESACERSIALREENGDEVGLAFSRYNLADVRRRLGDVRGARRLLGQALAGFEAGDDAEGQARVHNLFGSIATREGALGKARDAHQRAFELASAGGYVEQADRALEGIGHVEQRDGHPGEALAAWRRVFESREARQARLPLDGFRIGFASVRTDLAERIVELEMAREPAPHPSAFAIVERSRGRGSYELRQDRDPGRGGERDVGRDDREAELLDRISRAVAGVVAAAGTEGSDPAATRLHEAEAELAEFRIESRNAGDLTDRSRPAPSSLSDIQQVLQPDETLLRYMIGEERSYLWVVDARDARVISLGSRRSIERAIEAHADGIRGPQLGLSGEGATAAESALTEALGLTEVTLAERLLVVPDGALRRVPFAALRRGQDYLIENHQITMIPSASLLRLMRLQPAGIAPAGMWAVGSAGGRFGATEFAALPHSNSATERIAGTFDADHTAWVPEGRITRADFLAVPLERYRYLHLSTHGWVDDELPRRVGLWFPGATDEEEGWLLQPDDALALELAAELVVLSACQSGSGEVVPGEGVVGLARAFLAAGAQTTLVGLWNLEDATAAEFLESFYARLSAGESAAAALRATQLAFLESDVKAFRQPYRWAPFVLIGDPYRSDPKVKP
ncbi:hypothetical protein ABI59_12790 [Acidobacteria bacterium Mor1]|nr:hypothetical protein ABI59_12790 [Acidobacteria bacterium Mor1]